jgi:hypothetical protein
LTLGCKELNPLDLCVWQPHFNPNICYARNAMFGELADVPLALVQFMVDMPLFLYNLLNLFLSRNFCENLKVSDDGV